jgi:hypothetical protein
MKVSTKEYQKSITSIWESSKWKQTKSKSTNTMPHAEPAYVKLRSSSLLPASSTQQMSLLARLLYTTTNKIKKKYLYTTHGNIWPKERALGRITPKPPIRRPMPKEE